MIAGLSLLLIGVSYALYTTYSYENSNLVSGQPQINTLGSNPSSNCGSLSGEPTDNPIAAQYNSSAYPWTNQIQWDCVYNINDFKGSTTEKFNSARDTAAARGGGVVYFPAGNYNFTDSIYLKNGVVLRGETPSVIESKSNSYAPPAKLVFPKYEPRLSGSGTPNQTAFKKILTTSPNQDSNIGLVNLDINRAGIELGDDVDKSKNQNIVIFGIRSNNVAEPDPRVPDLSFQQPWMRYSHRFAVNIKINAYKNVLVGNNRINDAITDSYEQPGYKVKSIKGNSIITYTEGGKVPFDYGNHYGIVINRSKSSSFKLAATPKAEPGLFREGIVIRDNWIYHTMRVGISASGDGLVIQNNQITDQSGKQWWTDPTGLKQPRGAVTLENRGIDWSGWNVRIEGNDYEVYRHRVMDSNYLSVDGEGILIQECCGGTTVNGANITNNEGNAYIGIYKIPEIKNVIIQGNKLVSNRGDTPLIRVNADTNNRANSMENVRIEKNTIDGGILAKASLGGKGNVIRNNQGNNRGAIARPCHVTVTGNTGFKLKPCDEHPHR